jgi:hypothetical protein
MVLVYSSLHHLTAARADVSRLAQELVELRESRVQPVLPSAWLKREHKYKQDHEKFEHTVAMQRQRIAKLEAEVAVLREGGSIRPLEERIEVGWVVVRGGVGVDGLGIGMSSAMQGCRVVQGLASRPEPTCMHPPYYRRRRRSWSSSCAARPRRRSRCRASSTSSRSSTGS